MALASARREGTRAASGPRNGGVVAATALAGRHEATGVAPGHVPLQPGETWPRRLGPPRHSPLPRPRRTPWRPYPATRPATGQGQGGRPRRWPAEAGRAGAGGSDVFRPPFGWPRRRGRRSGPAGPRRVGSVGPHVSGRSVSLNRRSLPPAKRPRSPSRRAVMTVIAYWDTPLRGRRIARTLRLLTAARPGSVALPMAPVSPHIAPTQPRHRTWRPPRHRYGRTVTWSGAGCSFPGPSRGDRPPRLALGGRPHAATRA